MKQLSISLDGAQLLVHIPSAVNEDTSHTVNIPFSVGGLQLLRKILRERQNGHDLRIGNASSPTQQMVEQWLATDRQLQSTVPLLQGIDLSSIDLDL